MKIRPSMLGSVAVVAVLIGLLFWFGKKKPAEPPSPTAVQTSAAPVSMKLTAKPVQSSTTADANEPAASIASGTKASAPAAQPNTDSARQGLAALNDVPIIFYGKLEDQFRNPVDGAQVAASVRIYNGSRSTVERFSVTSDAAGFFQINHGKGESLGLVPRKDGYVLAAANTEYKYSFMYQEHFSPDPHNPVVIKMWKLQGAEPLAGIERTYKLPYTSAPICFDLLAGKVVPVGGDIKLTVNRSPGVVSERTLQDWSVQIEAVDGGVIQTSREYEVTYEAPESGYQPGASFVFSTNAPHKWSGGFSQGFFVMSRNGRVYSKLGVSFGINQRPDELMYIILSGVANTNGSRNWEATVPQAE